MVCAALLAVTVSRAEDAKPGAYTVKEDIEFRHEPVPLKLDAHLPPGNRTVSAVILVHGGGWTSGSKTADFVRPLFPVLDQTGCAWFTVDYRLAPKAPYTAQIDDVEHAIAFVKEHAREYHVNPKKIALIGESAGAHLVNLIGARNHAPADVAAVVSCYGPINIMDTLRLKPGSPINDGLRAVFQIQELDDAGVAKMREGSPDTYITSHTAPFLFIHGTKDPAVPYEQSLLGMEMLKKVGVPCELITVQDGVHGVINWEKEERFRGYKPRLIAWLKERLK